MTARGDGPPGGEPPENRAPETLEVPLTEFDELLSETTQVTKLRWKEHQLKQPEGLLVTMTHDKGIEACRIEVGKSYLLGRVPPADLCIPDPSLSRMHARIRLNEEEDALIVEDLGSTNGVWRGEEKITSTTLSPGGELRAGNVLLRVRWDGAARREPPAGDEGLATHEHLDAVNHMVTGVAHEINTPLGIINNATSFLTDGLPSEALEGLRAENSGAMEALTDLAEAGELIRKNAARLDKLVSSFKHLSAQQFTEDRAELHLPEVIDEALLTYPLHFESKGRLRVEVQDRRAHPERRWLGYRERLSKVLHNLLSNIERYAYSEAGGPVEIRLTDRGEEGLTILVRDQGKGIPEADLPMVFNPFFTTGRSFGATGLGLTVVHNLVSVAMRGEVRISSALGSGTSVTLELPWACPEA